MLGLVAATAIFSVVSEASALESANVVGYQNLVLETGHRNFIGATFLPIGTTMKMGDIGVNENFAPLSDTIYTIDEFGGAKALYVYVDEETGELVGGGEGWYLQDDLDNWDEESALSNHNNDTLAKGEMIVVSTGTEGAAVVFAGQVSAEDIPLNIDPSSRNFLSNCTPVDLTLGQIAPNELFAPLSDTLYTIDEFGGAKALYVYVDEETGELVGGGEGWYLQDDLDNWDEESALTNHNSDPIPAGLGFVVSTGTVGAQIILPSPL
jgi:hypothetical protein